MAKGPLPPSCPIVANETERLAVLYQYMILDTPPEEAFEHITRSLALSLDVPMVLISLIDEKRQWFKSAYGLNIRETPREFAFCTHAIVNDETMVVPDVKKDVRFVDNPLVSGEPYIRFYAGAPLLTKGGYNLGTLCALDTKPQELSKEQLLTLSELSKLVVELFDLRLNAKNIVESEQSARFNAERQIEEKTLELRESDDRFHNMASHIPGIVYQFKIDSAGNPSFPYVSPTIKDFIGIEAEDVMRDPNVWFDTIHPDDRLSLDDSIEETHRTFLPWSWEGRVITSSGKTVWFRGTSTPRVLPDGAVLWNGLVLDITDQKHTEEQLLHTQKMEVLGQLTGGIAHDFNNLLAVVQGNAELLYDDLDSSNTHILAIQRAAKRGAELTHRLLSYARRQSLMPENIAPGNLVTEISQMLAHSLGGTITLKTTTPPELWQALADPGQVEHALLNLAINARDAMPNGGTLKIECANLHLVQSDIDKHFGSQTNDTVAAGDYVMISVEDNGVGMSADTLKHAFDPFFTTKEIGEGSGLGLSMVQGFARQSGGDVTIESTPDKGTTVKIYLPRALPGATESAPPEIETNLTEMGKPYG